MSEEKEATGDDLTWPGIELLQAPKLKVIYDDGITIETTPENYEKHLDRISNRCKSGGMFG